jgi:hypothetical protein
MARWRRGREGRGPIGLRQRARGRGDFKAREAPEVGWEGGPSGPDGAGKEERGRRGPDGAREEEEEGSAKTAREEGRGGGPREMARARQRRERRRVRGGETTRERKRKGPRGSERARW